MTVGPKIFSARFASAIFYWAVFDNIMYQKLFIILCSWITNDMVKVSCFFSTFGICFGVAHSILFHVRYHVTKFHSIYIT